MAQAVGPLTPRRAAPKGPGRQDLLQALGKLCVTRGCATRRAGMMARRPPQVVAGTTTKAGNTASAPPDASRRAAEKRR